MTSNATDTGNPLIQQFPNMPLSSGTGLNSHIESGETIGMSISPRGKARASVTINTELGVKSIHLGKVLDVPEETTEGAPTTSGRGM